MFSSDRFDGPPDLPPESDRAPDGRGPLTEELERRYHAALMHSGLPAGEVNARVRDLRGIWHSSLVQAADIPIAGIDQERTLETIEVEPGARVLDVDYWLDALLRDAPEGMTAWPKTAEEYDAWRLWREAVAERCHDAVLTTAQKAKTEAEFNEIMDTPLKLLAADDARLRTPPAAYDDLRR